MTRRHRVPCRRGALLLVPLLVLAGCGLDETQQDVADQFRTAISAGDDAEDARDLAECTADRWVGEAGLGPLREDGLVTGEDGIDEQAVRETATGQRPASEPVARAFARARVSCLDLDAESSEVRSALPDASVSVRDAYAGCLTDISDDLREEAYTQRVRGNSDAEAVGRLDRERRRCLEEAQG